MSAPPHVIFAVLAVFVPHLHGLPVEAILSDLSSPIVVQTRAGRDVSGHPVEVNPERVVLRVEADGGSVEYTFGRVDVVQVRLPGNRIRGHALDRVAAGHADEGLDLIDLLYRQRAAFLPWMPESEAVWFAETVPLLRENGRVDEAVERARALREAVSRNEAASDLLRDEILLGVFRRGDPSAARELAQAWIAGQPREAESALGWFVLGALQMQDEAPEDAFFTFLRPVVFSGPRPMPHLGACYAGAIDAAMRLNRTSAARSLWNEMASRGLEWPTDRVRPAFTFESPLQIHPVAESP